MFASQRCLLHLNLPTRLFETNADVASSAFDSLITILTAMSKSLGCVGRGVTSSCLCKKAEGVVSPVFLETTEDRADDSLHAGHVGETAGCYEVETACRVVAATGCKLRKSAPLATKGAAPTDRASAVARVTYFAVVT